ncbi:MAG: DUF1476 domain-containing protein [Rhodospirillales bacterium]|nr:DUF1476 domain-containing protein [Rhodospirillales bacterium]
MSDTFKDREKSFEAKFKLDAELKFKAESRRNKLLGLWVAEKMGMAGEEANAYAKEVVMADLEEPGIEDVVRKVMQDLRERKVGVDESEVRKQIDSLFATAVDQVKSEYPEALGSNHTKVGD